MVVLQTGQVQGHSRVDGDDKKQRRVPVAANNVKTRIASTVKNANDMFTKVIDRSTF